MRTAQSKDCFSLCTEYWYMDSGTADFFLALATPQVLIGCVMCRPEHGHRGLATGTVTCAGDGLDDGVCVWASRCVCRVECTIGTLAPPCLLISLEATAHSRTVELVPWQLELGAPQACSGSACSHNACSSEAWHGLAWHSMAWAVHCMRANQVRLQGTRPMSTINHVIGGLCRVAVQE